jgi:hypothetical protein
LIRSNLFGSRHHRRQAREYGYTVLTRDRALLDYAAVGYLSALAC